MEKIKKLKASDYKRKRIIGTEQEYGIWNENEEDGYFYMRNEFISNGGFIYEDCGHPEYASPEASNPPAEPRPTETPPIFTEKSPMITPNTIPKENVSMSVAATSASTDPKSLPSCSIRSDTPTTVNMSPRRKRCDLVNGMGKRMRRS